MGKKGKLKQALQKQKHAQNLQKTRQTADKRRQQVEEARKVKRQTHQRVVPQPPFAPTDKLLLVGEGDFSFAHAVKANGLAQVVVPTAYDAEHEVRDKYPSTAPHKLQYLAENGCPAVYGVDAAQLAKHKQVKKQAPFDVVMFNFPHIGNSVKDQARNILQHQKLCLAYFDSAQAVVGQNGKVVVTLFEGEPYNSWNLKKLARAKNLVLDKSQVFHWETYPGYMHRLTSKEGITAKPQATRPARVYTFVKPGAVTKAPAKRKQDSDSDSDGGDDEDDE